MQRRKSTYNAKMSHATPNCDMQRQSVTYNAKMSHATPNCHMQCQSVTYNAENFGNQHTTPNYQHTTPNGTCNAKTHNARFRQ